jgi:hypothetical protein
MKVFINHVNIVEKGPHGPWGYALVSAPDAPRADVVELRGLGLETLQRLLTRNVEGRTFIDQIRDAGEVLSLNAEMRVKELVEEFTTKKGEPATKSVVRLYLESTPEWARVTPPIIGEGNLSDVLGDLIGAPAADDEF